MAAGQTIRSAVHEHSGALWVAAQSVLLLVAAAVSIIYSNGFEAHSLLFVGAIVLFGLSALFGIAGVVALGRNRTPQPMPADGAELVQSGIYSVVRHPLYLSMMLWAISWPLFWRSSVGSFAVPIVCLFFDCKARYEEKQLRRVFPQYDEYAREVARFIPGIY